MSKHDEARRAFLVGAVAGAGAAAGAGLAPQALAQTAPQLKEAAPAAHAHSTGAGHGAFFNDENVATVAAFAERLMPGAPGKPGALDAGVRRLLPKDAEGAVHTAQRPPAG